MRLYGGMDLHADNVYCAIMNEKFEVVYEKRFPNNLPMIVEELKQYRDQIVFVVESTFNWYWLVDGLRAMGFTVILANPARMQENIGLKNANDKTDARFLAKQAAMGVLPQAYIYPKEQRPLRDLLRRRLTLVHTRTAEWLRLESLVARHTGRDLGLRALDTMSEAELKELLGNDELVLAMAKMSFEHIEFLNGKIKAIEDVVEPRVKLVENYAHLLTTPGIGRILGMTIMLETGPIRRFPGAGNYASYCRSVKSEHTSNGKKKGEGNSKSGNRYLAWAYVEAANFAVRYSPELRAWYQRKATKTKRVVAIKAIATKLSKACFYIMRDGVDFDVKRLLG
jgi:transposase